MHSCNYQKHKILSLNWLADCCSGNTKLTATDQKNELRYYLGSNIWLISVRPELYGGNNSLFAYLNSTKKLSVTKEFGDIKIYKFE